MRYFLSESHYHLDSDTACTKSLTASLYLAAPNSISILVTKTHPLSHQELTPLHMRSSGHPDQ